MEFLSTAEAQEGKSIQNARPKPHFPQTNKNNIIVCYIASVFPTTTHPFPGGGGGNSHMKQTGMLVGNFEFNP